MSTSYFDPVAPGRPIRFCKSVDDYNIITSLMLLKSASLFSDLQYYTIKNNIVPLSIQLLSVIDKQTLSQRGGFTVNGVTSSAGGCNYLYHARLLCIQPALQHQCPCTRARIVGGRTPPPPSSRPHWLHAFPKTTCLQAPPPHDFPGESLTEVICLSTVHAGG